MVLWGKRRSRRVSLPALLAAKRPQRHSYGGVSGGLNNVVDGETESGRYRSVCCIVP